MWNDDVSIHNISGRKSSIIVGICFRSRIQKITMCPYKTSASELLQPTLFAFASIHHLTFSALHTFNRNCCNISSKIATAAISVAISQLLQYQYISSPTIAAIYIERAYGITINPPSDLFLPIFHQPAPSPSTYLHHARDCWLQLIPPHGTEAKVAPQL